jgi:transcriptional regulator with GAF, ATPase, and Fis domain
MQFACLRVEGGPLEGRTFRLSSESVEIGREIESDICIPDAAISRHHCVLEALPAENGDIAFQVRDLGSSNGTYVNDGRIQEAELRAGDRLRVGTVVLIYRLEQEPSLSDESLPATIRIDTVAPATPVAFDGHPLVQRYAADLDRAVQLAACLQGENTVPSACDVALQTVIELSGAEWAGVTLQKPAEQSIFTRAAAGVPENCATVSRTLVQAAMERRSAVSIGDCLGESSITSSPSIGACGIRSVLVVPLEREDQPFGTLFIASRKPNSFDAFHRRFATVAASLLAPALIRAEEFTSIRRLRDALLDRIEHDLIGESGAIRQVLKQIGLLSSAHSDAPVLIQGESGTGKELAARAVHRNSSRGKRLMIAVNCAALNPNLVESELFGHERGAFTGALRLRKGLFEQADGSTIFLDEIGELPLAIQAKLLRILETHEVTRVGGERPIPVNFRLVAATNRDLAAAVKEGLFRADLLYRIGLFSITMPPLRERPEDIIVIATHFLTQLGRNGGRAISGIGNGARRCLLSHSWPGNVRELRNVIEYATIVGRSPLIEREDLPETLFNRDTAPDLARAYHVRVREAKREIIQEALASAGGSHKEAAALLEVHPNNLHRMLRELGLRKP